MLRIWFICLLSFGFSGFSQSSIPSLSLSVTFQKTTNLIFPYRIEKADIGSADVIGHKDELLQNVLFLKANRKGFVPTNLSVYTSDGKFYSFIVVYKEDPDTLNLSFVKDQKSLQSSVDSFNEASLDSDAVSILNQSHFLHQIASAQKMKAVLNAIYLKDHMIWLRIEIKNRSEMDYKPEYIKFYVRDKKAGKRTAVQETELSPVWQSRKFLIPGNGRNSLVFAFPQFTIDKQKKLVIQISEENGGRSFTLPLKSKTILKARPILN